MNKIFLLVGAIICFVIPTYAQPDLPNMATLSQGGINILSWNNPHTTSVKAVLVERSAQEDTGFVLIGNVDNIKKPIQFFTDAEPLPGNNYYRVKVIFTTNIAWYSNVFLVNADSVLVSQRKGELSEDSVKKLVEQLGIVEEVPLPPSGEISKYVYANPYNGNVNIEFADALEVAYKVVFYDIQGKEAVVIPRVNDTMVILDKRNFQKIGQYRFVVFREEKEFTTGIVSIY